MHKFTYNKKTWNSEFFQVHFDVPEYNSTSNKIAGWFVSKASDEFKLKLVREADNSTESIVLSKIRPRLSSLFPTVDNVINSGFEVLLEELSSSSDYYIAVFKGDELIDKVLSFMSKPPLLYVHIAKTAGSTVNKVLTELFSSTNSIIHAESNADWKNRVSEGTVDFLSGHIPYKAFLQLDELKHYKKSITFREPYSHVISHISWIRALALSENKVRYNEHPDYIQKLSDKLASFDLSKPSEISKVILSFAPLEHRLLDNTQTRYIRTDLVKAVVDEHDLVDARNNLKYFDYIGNDNNIGGFLEKIARDYQFTYQPEDRRENVLATKFGLDIDNVEIKKALLPLVKFDLELYKKYSEKL